MASSYSVEFAVQAKSELSALRRLEALGITNALEAKLTDLDRQADLFIIKLEVAEKELTDHNYNRLLKADDICILADGLAKERAQEIIELTTPVERQIKKLLICILPETEKIFLNIIESHQKYKSKLVPTSRIEWSRKINDFSFGELPRVLGEDIAKLTKDKLLTKDGLLSFITDANDFDSLKSELINLSKSRTIWDSISTVLDNTVDFGYISKELLYLCDSRNKAAHLQTILEGRIGKVKKYQTHVMRHIVSTKSSYRDGLLENMSAITKSLKPIFDSAIKIDPKILDSFSTMSTEMLKPLEDTLSRLQLDIQSPGFLDAIKRNANYQNQISNSFTDIFKKAAIMPEHEEMMNKLATYDFSTYSENELEEVNELKSKVDRLASEKEKQLSAERVENEAVASEDLSFRDSDNYGDNKMNAESRRESK